MFSSRLRGLVLLPLALAGCAAAPRQSDTPAVATPEVKVPGRLAKPPRIGLALGGGAARGFAHIGVIQVLEEQGIKVDLVAGTSAGSLVAALYASGKNGRELAALAETMDEGSITDWAFPTRGLIRGEALARYVREKTGNKLIEQMSIPLGIVATDLSDGAAILFRTGDTGAAVRASSSVPALFQPVRIGTRDYVDGGLVAPVPVRFAREMGADFVIAVNISTQTEKQVALSSLEVLMQTFSIMGQRINQFELKDADIVIEPGLGSMKGNDFNGRNLAILAGEQAAFAVMPQIKQKLKALREQ